MTSEDMIKKLTALKETVESLEKQIERGMTQKEKEEAIEKVSQTIELLQQMQSSEALKTARVVNDSDQDERPTK